MLKPTERASPRSMAIACHDIGEFVRNHARGKA
jgi:hypothetical protein